MKHEILRKSIDIAFDLFVKPPSGNAVGICKVPIYDDFLSADKEDISLNSAYFTTAFDFGIRIGSRNERPLCQNVILIRFRVPVIKIVSINHTPWG